MSDFTISNLMKLILGILVFVIVVVGVTFFFKNNFIDFFKNFIN